MNTVNIHATADRVLDARGLTCPLPVLRARKAVGELPAGGVLRIELTDPGAPKDFEHFCKAGGHQLLSSSADNGVFVLLIKKAA
jgi:tRNA 2-thiouridine synthesizing protein A